MAWFGWEDLRVVVRDVGEVLFYFSIAMLVPIPVGLYYGEGPRVLTYFLSAALTAAFGYGLKTACATKKETRDVHAAVAVLLVWLILPAFGAIPYYFITGRAPLDCYFESVSALTTTGLTLFTPTELTPGLVFWRSIECWIGGAGIVVLALIGITRYVKSYRLYVAEARDQRLKPHILHTIERIWAIYLGMTLIGTMALMALSIDPFTAANLSMSAVSTTGFTPMAPEMLAQISPMAELVLGILMFTGAISFATHYHFLKGRLGAYFADVQVRLLLLFIAVGAVLLLPRFVAIYGFEGIRIGLFHITGAVTCGGFNSVSVAQMEGWDAFTKLIMVAIMVVGGSAGSTAGGIKMLRFWIALKALWWKIKEIYLPQKAVFARQVGGVRIEEREINTVLLFILLYITFLFAGVAVLASHGASLSNALFETAAAQGNVGLSVGITRTGMPQAVEIMLIVNMLVGRLEIIPILAGAGFIAGAWRR